MGLGYVDIIESAETRIGTILPAYKKILKQFNLEAESKRILDKGFSINYGDLSEDTAGTTRALTTRGTLNIVLTNSLNLRNDNQDLILDLYADIETLIRSFKDGSQLSSSALLDIGAYSISTPTLIGEEHIYITITFNVLFRELL